MNHNNTRVANRAQVKRSQIIWANVKMPNWNPMRYHSDGAAKKLRRWCLHHALIMRCVAVPWVRRGMSCYANLPPSHVGLT